MNHVSFYLIYDLVRKSPRKRVRARPGVSPSSLRCYTSLQKDAERSAAVAGPPRPARRADAPAEAARLALQAAALRRSVRREATHSQ
eukprot:531329-Prymnesium_polylepis.1